jgi:hypothetical protein
MVNRIWWRYLSQLTTSLRAFQKGKPIRRKPGLRLRLEELESRLVPTLIFNSGQESIFNGTEPGSVFVHDNPNPPPLTTTVDVIGGSIGFGGGSLNAYDSSRVNISGGSIGYGGGNLYAYDSSIVNVSGGTVGFAGNLNARHSSVVNISGGSVAYAGMVDAYDSSKINISGGSVAQSGILNAYGSGVITIFGTGFNLPYGLVTQTSGSLSGVLTDGSSLDVQFATLSHGEIILSPPLPVVSVTALGGVYNGLPHPVTGASVTGIGNVTLATFGDPSLSYSYYAGATVSGTGSASAPINAGTYTVVAHWASNNPKYVNTDGAPATFTITPAPLTVTGITANDKVYDATTTGKVNTGSASLMGVLAGDTVTLNTAGATGTFASKDVGNGITVLVSGLTLGGAQAGDYTLLPPPATMANITPATLTATGITANNKVYDATTKATLNASGAALAGVFAGDAVILNTAGATGTFASKDVGNAITVAVAGLTLGGAQAGDYSLTQPAATASITPATLTVTGITANNKVYDATVLAALNTGNAALVGVFSGDTVTLDTGSATGTFASKDVGNGITVSVSGLTLGGAQAGDYSVTQPTTTANITPASLAVNGLTANNKAYDGTTKATLNTSNAALVGVFSGDTVTLTTAGATGTFASKGVGNGITVTISGLTLGGAQAGDYTLLPPPATTANIAPDLVINPLFAKVGLPATFSSVLLKADRASAPSTVVFTLVSIPASGTLKDGNSVLAVNSTFTQADINSGKLTYTGAAVGPDSFQFSATDGQGGTVPTTTFHITVGPNISLPRAFVSPLSNLEGLSGLTPFVFQVKLLYDGSTSGPVTYDVYTIDGTAKAGINFVGITAGDSLHGGTVTFAEGSNYATVTVYVITGSLPVRPGTSTATFTVNLSDPSNAGVPLASGIGTIVAQTTNRSAAKGVV